MTDLYAILGLKPDAEEQEIKSAFRQLAHRLHPDKNPGRENWAEARMRTLIEAYRILSTPSARDAYDRLYRQTYPSFEDEDPYVARLRQQIDTASRVTLLMHLMYENRGAEGLEIYEELVEKGIQFSFFLHLNEYLDLRFLVAEEREKQGSTLKAFRDYLAAYRHGASEEVFGFFRQEILERLSDLFLGPLAASSADELLALGEELVSIESVQSRIKGMVYRKVAEAYLEEGQINKAQRNIRKGLELFPAMSCTRLMKQIFPEKTGSSGLSA